MGAFFTNIQVRNGATKAICSALPRLTTSRAYVSPPRNGWVTVYAEATEDQSDPPMLSLAEGLSRMFKTDVLGLLVHDSDIAMYWLYRCGEPLDQFNSLPDYFGETVDDETREQVRGNTDILLPLCVAGTTRAQLDEVLHPPDGPGTIAEEIVSELAKLLGIDEARACVGFKYFAREGREVLPDATDFEPVGSAERKTGRPAAATARKGPAGPLPSHYAVAVGMLARRWSREPDERAEAFASFSIQYAEEFGERIRNQLDIGARDLLKKPTVPGQPTFEELKAARDHGPAALAALIAARTPGEMTEIGVGAAVNALEEFVAALLKCGLDPTAITPAGRSTIEAAARHGMNSAIYKLVKAAARRR